MIELLQPLPDVLPFLLIGGLFDLFSKKVNQTSTTSNVDNTRVNTLTDSLNNFISQTRADSRVYNSAFDATDSFNTVMSYNLANIGGGPSQIPTLDFTGLRELFATPQELAELTNANRISKDPNANKYDWNFTETSAGGNDFLAQVQNLVRSQWEGLSGAASPKSNLMLWTVIGLAAIFTLVIARRFLK